MKTISFEVILDDNTAEVLERLKRKHQNWDDTMFFMEAVVERYWNEIEEIRSEMRKKNDGIRSERHLL